MVATFEQTQAHYSERYSNAPFFKTWIPKEKFISAEINGGNMAISREDGDDVYGMALGISPVIPTSWKKFSIDSRAIGTIPEGFEAKAEWDAYWSPTVAGELNGSPAFDDAVIRKFLEAHAPGSSVFPGNREIEKWVTILDKNELVAVAALCRWESGFLVVSSVATHTEYRGRGFGRKVMQDSLVEAHQLGATELSLGVMHSNVSAKKLYESMGFRLMHSFAYCEAK